MILYQSSMLKAGLSHMSCWQCLYISNLSVSFIRLSYDFFFHGKGLILIDIIKTSGTKRKSTMTHINFFEVVCG